LWEATDRRWPHFDDLGVFHMDTIGLDVARRVLSNFAKSVPPDVVKAANQALKQQMEQMDASKHTMKGDL